MSFLRPQQRAAIEQDLQSAESLMKDPQASQYIEDKAAMRKHMRNMKTQLERDAPKPYESPQEITKMVARERELRERWSDPAVMPSQEEMRRNRAGSTHKHLQWDKHFKNDVLEWKEIKARLDWQSEDPDLCNIERYRPSRPFGYDTTAQIGGHHAMSPLAKENFPEDMGNEVKSAVAHLAPESTISEGLAGVGSRIKDLSKSFFKGESESGEE